MSPPAVVYIRTDAGEITRQHNVCIETCIDAGITIGYWAQGGDGALADALRLIAAGKASTLVAAHPKVLGGRIDLVRSQIAQAGGELLLARGAEQARRPRTAELAQRMAQHGMSAAQIANILSVDEAGARALLRSGRIHKAFGFVGLGTVHDEPGRAVRTVAVAAVVMATLWAAAPFVVPYQPPAPWVAPYPTVPAPSPTPGDEKPGEPSVTPRAPGAPTPAPSPPTRARPPFGPPDGVPPTSPPQPPGPAAEHEHCLHLDPLLINPPGCPERLGEFVQEVLPSP